MMRLAYTRPDGGLSIVSAATKEQIDRVLFVHVFDENGMLARDAKGIQITRLLTEDEYRSHVIMHTFERLPPGATDFHVLPDDWTPPDIDRAYRNAWRLTGRTIFVDMAHARELHRNHMRRSRRRLLEQLDVQMARAMEQPGTDLEAIVAAKQILRDVTADPAIEAAQTTEELRRIWPAALGARA